MRKDIVVVGASCGILAPIIWSIFYLIAWSHSPWYEFGGHYLSDLGVGQGAWAFNTGNVIAGLLAIPFAVAVWKTLKPGWLPLLGSVFCAAGGVALAGVGIVNQNIDGHVEVTATFFILAFLFESILGLALIRNEKTRIAGYTVTVLLVATLIAGGIVGINPLSETIAVMEVLVWAFLVGGQVLLVTLKEGRPSREPQPR
jgi:hypothetical membrane protein